MTAHNITEDEQDNSDASSGFMLDALPVATWTWDQWHSIQVNGDILRWLG